MSASFPAKRSLTLVLEPSGRVRSASRIFVLSKMMASAPKFGWSNTVGRVSNAKATKAPKMGSGSMSPFRKALVT